MKFVRLLVVLLATVAMFGGCASRSLAPAKADALAKLMHPVADKAVIYLFRSEMYSAPFRVDVTLDGKDMGSTGANTYFRWTVEPGQHIIISRSENDAGLVLDVQAGQMYYVWQDISMGYFRPRSELKQVDRDTAEIELRSCYLLQNRG